MEAAIHGDFGMCSSNVNPKPASESTYANDLLLQCYLYMPVSLSPSSIVMFRAQGRSFNISWAYR